MDFFFLFYPASREFVWNFEYVFSEETKKISIAGNSKLHYIVPTVFWGAV